MKVYPHAIPETLGKGGVHDPGRLLSARKEAQARHVAG